MTSRWAEDPETEAELQRRRLEKEAKKRAKAERLRQQAAGNSTDHSRDSDIQTQQTEEKTEETAEETENTEDGPPSKRRRLSDARLLQLPAREWAPCRHIGNFEILNAIEEGSYGWVSRARETATGQVVAVKKLKMDHGAVEGFPVTGLREIQTLLASSHPHIVRLREVVMGDSNDDVFLVMDFIEHDLKSLLDEMREPFLPSETKTLLLQVLGAAEFLHSHWIMHRDLKTSNLLMNNRGEIKLADFGMARYYGDPPPELTQLVVTLWYRAPELLLGAERYGTEIDMWSIGCIFGELLTKEPLLRGKNEVSQLAEIFALTGAPTSHTWPGFRTLPNAKSLRLPSSSARVTPSETSGPAVPLLPRSRFPYLTSAGLGLLSHLLALNPAARPSAKACLSHPYFREDPKPKPKEMFPTFPSKANLEKRRRRDTPEAPKRGAEAPKPDFANVFGGGLEDAMESGAGFALRLG